MTGVAPDKPAPGDQIAERYRVLGELGTGGMGSVYRVEHTMMAKEMAMKLLRPELSGITEVAERFEREAKSAARLDHPHIVRVTDFGKTEAGELFLVMELLEGQPLTDYGKQHGRLEPSEAIYLVDQILEALEHAHNNGVIHRDLKPDNCMLVDREGQRVVKILDFGLAKITETKMEDGKQLTTAGTVFGTPRYMSPEQAAAEPTDHRSDLYSVGVMLYELVTGAPPFTGESTVDVLRQHLTKPPPPLDVPGMRKSHREALEAVVHRAMAKSPDERFFSAAEFRDALAACATGADPTFVARQTRLERPPTEPPRELVPRRIPRSLPLIGGAAGVLGAVLVAVSLTSTGTPTSGMEDALEAGDTGRATALLAQMRKESPDDERHFLYEGHIAFLAEEPTKALVAYRKALKNDPALGVDDRMKRNILGLVKFKPKQAKEFVELMVESGGPSAAPLLAEVFEEAPTASLRRRAYAGLRKLDEVDELSDPVKVLSDDLRAQKNRHCSVRKWYVEQLLEFDDDRVLDALESETARRGNILQRTFGGGVNRCMGRLLADEIEKRRS